MEDSCSVILAAGNGKRMKSKHPKVMCEVLFRPMISWVADAATQAGVSSICAVVSQSDQNVLSSALPQGAETVCQDQRLGTGHAAKMAAEHIRQGGFSHVLVLCGDAPFIAPEDITGAYRQHTGEGNAVTVLSAILDDPSGYGRIIRENGRVTGIIEQADATPEQLAVTEMNSGAFWFRSDFLLYFFDHMTCENKQGEYYLTDAVACANRAGHKVGAYIAGPDVVLGANDRAGLARLNELARQRVLEHHRAQGVDIPFNDGIIIGSQVEIGCDTRILPGTILKGRTVIGQDCEIGPNSHLDNASVGDGCTIISSYIDSSRLDDGVKLGPMSNLRPNCHVGKGAKIGDFVELKNSNIGAGTSVAHLTYIGDSDVGERCNFGCGVVTVNYDGTNKHRTTIGNRVFVGCNTNLVAPVTMEDGSYSAAGTTVTHHVPKDSLAIGRVKQTVKEGWVKKRGLFRK